MFVRLRKFLGNVLYWIGWGLAVLVILLAITVAVSSGNPLLPLLLGSLGVIVWLVAIGLKRILVDGSLRGRGR
jgi:FtsH-binding integral membrane protein